MKQEGSVWDWALASPAAGAPRCTLHEAVTLMTALTSPLNRFPAPFALLQGPKEAGDRKSWLNKFYQSVGTLRSLAKHHCATPDDATDYFAPLCLYAALVLRWCDPRTAADGEEKASRARRGVFVTALSGMLLQEGKIGVTAAQ